mgnify:CR=1 FL=1
MLELVIWVFFFREKVNVCCLMYQFQLLAVWEHITAVGALCTSLSSQRIKLKCGLELYSQYVTVCLHKYGKVPL